MPRLTRDNRTTKLRGRQVIDPLLYGQVAISEAHHQIHSSNMYMSTYCADVPASESIDIMFVADLVYNHSVWQVTAETGGIVNLFEGATWTGSGALLARYNMNRSRLAVPNSTVWSGPTLTTDGHSLFCTVVPSTGGTVRLSVREDSEWILKPGGTGYILRFTNASAQSACYVSLAVQWYETNRR